MKVISCEKEIRGFGLLVVAAAALVVSCTSGCVPALLGVKRIQSGDTTVEFITGADVTVGANGVDSVNNNRGIDPSGGVSRKGENGPRKY